MLSFLSLKSKLSFFFFFCISFLHAQTIIKGIVSEKEGQIITHGVVLLKDTETKVIKEYTNIAKNGAFTLTSNVNLKTLFLEVRVLGYEKKIISFNNLKEGLLTTKNIVLTPKFVELNEVIVSASPIKIKKDTIEYTASRFLRGNEENIEDLLKNLPGITIDADGKIKYDKTEIEKIMVDGDDLFGKGYAILSKNMPVNPVKKIEVLKNFSENKLLKGIDNTNKVALNLKLKEEFKRIWFGNLKSNISIANTKGFYNTSGNLMNFGEKSKHYMLANLNNTGFETTGDVQQLMSSVNLSGHLNQHSSPLLNLNIPQTVFSGERTNFNDSELVSTSSIYNITKDSKLKVVSFFNSDENYFVNNSFSEINTEVAKFQNTENTRFTNNKSDLLGKLEFSSQLFSKKDALVLKAAFKKNTSKKESTILFNDDSILEKINSKEEFADVGLQYTYKIDKTKVLLFNTNYSYNKSPQNYTINQFFYTDLFSNSNDIENIQQISDAVTSLSSVKATFHNKFSKKSYFKVALGNKHRLNKLKTDFLLFSDANTFTNQNYLNDLSFRTNDLYIKNTYRLKFKSFKFNTKLDLHYINNITDESTQEKEVESSFFINPKINIEWQIDRKNIIIFDYSYNTTSANVEDVFTNYVNTGFQTFLSGTGNFNLLNTSQLNLSYDLGNPNNDFLMRSNFSMTKMHDYFSTNTIINPNYSQSNKVLFKDRFVYTASQEFEYYFGKLSTNLRVGLTYNQSNYENLLDNLILRDIRTQNYKYKIEIRSAFGNDFFDYHVALNFNKTKIQASNDITSFTNTSFLNLYFTLYKKINLDVNSTFYDLSSEFSNSNIFFLDFNLKYKLAKEKITLGLIGKNLFNNKRYREVNITDNYYAVQSYDLLPRYVLLKLDYNF